MAFYSLNCYIVSNVFYYFCYICSSLSAQSYCNWCIYDLLCYSCSCICLIVYYITPYLHSAWLFTPDLLLFDSCSDQLLRHSAEFCALLLRIPPWGVSAMVLDLTIFTYFLYDVNKVSIAFLYFTLILILLFH